MQLRTVSRASSPAIAGLLLLLTGCAVNPATGERQLSLVSQEDEIRMGREADADIVRTLGVYPDSALQAYVSKLGHELAAHSERPDLPWTFRVVDDPVVNAFALPGGFVYVTRGILAHMTSEAELAGVLGHEIGHVTARHSVNRISRAQLAQLGLGIGMVFSPELRAFQNLAGAGLQLLFLKFSRDDERQADRLGVRYMERLDYDPMELADVMHVLGRASQASGSGGIPGWLSTHPDPGERETTIRTLAGDTSFDRSEALVKQQAYMRELQGLVFGDDPRQGYVKDDTFYHPELAFRMDFPDGWQVANQRQAVQAMGPEKDAALLLTLEDGDQPSRALRGFLAGEGISAGQTWDDPVHGLPAAWGTFSASGDGGDVRGMVVFLSYGGRLYRFLGYAAAGAWTARSGAIESSLGSFQQLTDRKALGVQPKRVALVRFDRNLSFEDFLKRYPSTVPPETVALINHVESDSTLEAGTFYKRIVGGGSP